MTPANEVARKMPRFVDVDISFGRVSPDLPLPERTRPLRLAEPGKGVFKLCSSCLKILSEKLDFHSPNEECRAVSSLQTQG